MDSFATVLSSNKQLFIYFSICISVPSVLLYCAEIWIILRHKSLHNSFYGLFVARASIDLLYTVDSYLGYRIPNIFIQWFLQQNIPNWALRMFIFLTAYTLPADNLSTFFTLLNRFTAIVFPIQHKTIWKKIFPLTLLAIYGIPLYAVGIFGIKLTIMPEKDAQNNVISVNVVADENAGLFNFFLWLGTAGSVLFLVLCSLLNLFTLVFYKRRPNTISCANLAQQRANARQARIEQKLWLFAIITFLGHALIAFLMIGLYYATSTGNFFWLALLSSQYSWIMDLGTVVLPSWLLLWASPSFRRKFMADLLPNWLLNMLAVDSQSANTVVKVSSVIIANNQQMPNSQIDCHARRAQNEQKKI